VDQQIISESYTENNLPPGSVFLLGAISDGFILEMAELGYR